MRFDNKSWIISVLTFLIIALFIVNWKQCDRVRSDKEEFKRYENNIIALNDSIEKVINKNGEITYKDKTVESTPEDIIKSQAFKTLSKERQKFYLDLVKTKGLLASAQAEVITQKQIIADLKYNSSTTVTDSTICFERGDTLSKNDSVNNLAYKIHLTFDDSLKIKLDYTSYLSFQTTYVREKDKSISVMFQTNDTNAIVLTGNSLFIPYEDQRTKWQKFKDKSIKVSFYIMPPVFLAVGAYLQNRLSK